MGRRLGRIALRAALVAILLLVSTFVASDARAEPSATLLARAEDSLSQKKWAAAEEDLRQAIRQGKLTLTQTQQAWTGLGVAASMRGHKGEARVAFLRAALISPKFELPVGTPARARAAADAARAEVKPLGRWQVTCKFPDKGRKDKPLPLEVSVELPKGGIAKKLKIVAEQFATNRRWEQTEEAAPTAYHFDVPVAVMTDSALLVVRLSVIDKEENVIAELSKVIPLVEGEAAVTPPPEDNGKPPEDNGKPPEDNGKPPETNGEPPAEAAKGPKVFDLHGTARSLSSALSRKGVPGSVIDGTSITQARLTAKLLPASWVTVETHVVNVLTYATFPFPINDGSGRYRALNLTNTYAGGDRSGAFIFVDRLSMKLAAPSFDVTIGRQPINFSKAYFWSPIDVFLPFTPSTIDRDYKPGVDAVRIDVPLGEAAGLNFVGVAGPPLTFDVLRGVVTVPSKPFSISGNSSAVFARAFGNFGGYDVSLQGGSVYGGYYGAAGIAGEVATLGVRAEASFFHPRNNPPIVIPSLSGTPTEIQPFVDHGRVVVGFERRFESSLYITTEYFFNGAAPGNNNYILPGIQQALGEIPNLSRHLVSAVMQYDIIPTVVARLYGIVGLASQASALVSPSIDWSAAENADLQLGALIAVGQGPSPQIVGPGLPNSEFGSFPSSVYMQFKVYF